MSSPAPTLYACLSFTEAGDCTAWAAVPTNMPLELPTVEEAALVVGCMFIILGTIAGLKRILKPERMVP